MYKALDFFFEVCYNIGNLMFSAVLNFKERLHLSATQRVANANELSILGS